MNPTPTEISITTGSRLHWGLLAGECNMGQSFGGVGVMIDQPSVGLTLRSNTTNEIIGAESTYQRVAKFVATYRENCLHEFLPPSCVIEIQNAIPSHRGLGSGTQLAMAVAHGLALLANDPNANDAKTLATRVKRAARSAVGVHGFFTGGLIADAGKNQQDDFSTIAATLPFPDQWCFLLITPVDETGLSGAAEKQAFQSFVIPAKTTAQLKHILIERLLPAVTNANFNQCSAAIYDYGKLAGTSFAKLQGGVFASPLMREMSQELHQKEIIGHGQTSWGPTLFTLLPSKTAAEKLKTDLQQNPKWATCNFQIATPLNRGATVQIAK